ncbi:hypothetical protein TetV_256 [Tetraselmis virus 1]|uniref:Uncharacterized protein n=1 Tax=Tetraselmis virus 1 TaxID=2060617 RepID=A0A2P0VN75_9VIRU|nr:hypothetical protein QJ968_gp256 [Tetraselmis virus 1]AUF82348.1 hypothetical protein TetV_256 [Tetraselmis virus 1]
MPTISGKVWPIPENKTVHWIGAKPLELMTSFSGSGMPYANEEQAWHETPLKGSVTVDETGYFEITFDKIPNMYHKDSSEHPLPPQIVLYWEHGGEMYEKAVPLNADPRPYRTLRPACSQVKGSTQFEDIQTQERYLRADAWKPDDSKFVP